MKRINPIKVVTIPPLIIAPVYKATPGDMYFWISSILTNDEYSTDQELVEHLITEGGLPAEQARAAVSHRAAFMAPPWDYEAGARILERIGIRNKKLI